MTSFKTYDNEQWIQLKRNFKNIHLLRTKISMDSTRIGPTIYFYVKPLIAERSTDSLTKIFTKIHSIFCRENVIWFYYSEKDFYKLNFAFQIFKEKKYLLTSFQYSLQ